MAPGAGKYGARRGGGRIYVLKISDECCESGSSTFGHFGIVVGDDRTFARERRRLC